MEGKDIIRHSNNAWVTPLHLNPKPDVLWRPYSDFGALDAVTEPEFIPYHTSMILLPNSMELSSSLRLISSEDTSGNPG